MINNSSIEWLADKIKEDSECDKNTLLHRFRGNFVVDGCIPFEETKWNDLKIGNCNFKVFNFFYLVKYCIFNEIYNKVYLITKGRRSLYKMSNGMHRSINGKENCGTITYFSGRISRKTKVWNIFS